MTTHSRGKREREARKRLRRGLYWNSSMPAGSPMLKLGHVHTMRAMRIVMADLEKPGRVRRNERRAKLPAKPVIQANEVKK
jgi:hypothetical protein